MEGGTTIGGSLEKSLFGICTNWIQPVLSWFMSPSWFFILVFFFQCPKNAKKVAGNSLSDNMWNTAFVWTYISLFQVGFTSDQLILQRWAPSTPIYRLIHLFIADYPTYNYTRWWFLPYFWIFHPEPWGRWTQFDDHIFQRGWFNHQPVYSKWEC